MLVEFNHNESHKIHYKPDLDLTVNSKMMIELTQTYCWLEPKDNIWSIANIIKVPD